eukprot:CAMPEP_0172170742 /NCGR_PEP_ID=MMETSP1050-20130122/11456_1 /TAXON_ID=233186 /ORGANISM="Cryptomonas curvata, Strain CCAP979/52" /LENGTH=405 /DNA_ID=CAMNT_0012841997 /DNA_START=373 /DNA_END=1590 /DNA_ORIENTATION=+
MRYPIGWKVTGDSLSPNFAFGLYEGEADVYVGENWNSHIGPGKMIECFGSLSSQALDPVSASRAVEPTAVICTTLCKCLVVSLDALRLLPGGSPEIVAALEKSDGLDDDPFFSVSSSPMGTSVTASLSNTPKSQNAPSLMSPASPISLSILAPFSDHHPGNISAAQTVSGQRPRLQQTKLSLASLRDQLRSVTGAHVSPERKDNRMEKEKSNSAVDDLLLALNQTQEGQASQRNGGARSAFNAHKDSMSEIPRATTSSSRPTSMGKGWLRVKKHDNINMKEISNNVVNAVGGHFANIKGSGNQSPAKKSEFSGDKRYIESDESNQEKKDAARQPTFILWKTQTGRLGGSEVSRAISRVENRFSRMLQMGRKPWGSSVLEIPVSNETNSLQISGSSSLAPIKKPTE